MLSKYVTTFDYKDKVLFFYFFLSATSGGVSL